MSGFLSSLDKAAEFTVLWVDHSFYNGIYTPTPAQKGKCEGYSLNKALGIGLCLFLGYTLFR